MKEKWYLSFRVTADHRVSVLLKAKSQAPALREAAVTWFKLPARRQANGQLSQYPDQPRLVREIDLTPAALKEFRDVGNLTLRMFATTKVMEDKRAKRCCLFNAALDLCRDNHPRTWPRALKPYAQFGDILVKNVRQLTDVELLKLRGVTQKDVTIFGEVLWDFGIAFQVTPIGPQK